MRDSGVPLRNGSDNYHAHQEIEDCHDQHGKNDRARNVLGWIFHFAAEIRNVVVSPVVVHGDQGCAGEPVEEGSRKMERAGWKIERYRGVHVNGASSDHPEHKCDKHESQHHDGKATYCFDRAKKKLKQSKCKRLPRWRPHPRGSTPEKRTARIQRSSTEAAETPGGATKMVSHKNRNDIKAPQV